MTRRSWTLLALSSASGAPMSPVQLQKALFLIGRNLSSEQRGGGVFYTFQAYDYGPFDSGVYADADLLQQQGFVRIVDGSPRTYSITDLGMMEAKRLRTGLQPEVVDYLDRVGSWVRSLSFSELVRAIYVQYPEMKANSVFSG